MNARTQIICAWCGILCPLFMFAALLPAGFVPPMSPAASAEEVAAFYQRNAIGIRTGMLFMLIAGALFGPFTAVIAAQMRRIEHRATPVLTYTQLAAGIGTIMLFLIPGLFWTAAAFRPERDPQVTQALNDVAWIFLVMPFVLGVTQNIALGVAIIGDKRAKPVFPRWVGYFNFWIALLYVPGGLMTYFKTGPFAWDGLFAFWLPASVFTLWFFLIGAYVIKAARQQKLDGE